MAAALGRVSLVETVTVRVIVDLAAMVCVWGYMVDSEWQHGVGIGVMGCGSR